MPEYKQIERIILILQRLALYKQVTVNSLYDYFDGRVPRRTIQRDLYELSNAGIPIVDLRGKGREKVYSIEGYFLKFIPHPLGNEEANAAFFLDKFAEIFEGTSIAEQARGLLEKARQLTPPKVVYPMETDYFPELFGITRIGYVDYSGHHHIIDRFIEAVKMQKVCKVAYNTPGSEEPNRFEVQPYLLLLHKGAMYGVVYLPYYEKFIYLHIHRMADIDILEEDFERDDDFSIEKLRRDRIGIFGQEDDKPETVVLKFDPVVADAVECRIWHNSQKCSRAPDGYLTLEMDIIISDELRGWILSWQDYIQVLQPESLVSDIKGKLNCIIEKYGGNDAKILD
ncbi:MAG: WYL domain-containing protein [candidate division Zixibacteria bacterium]|nr:WYL domain-containing protein [candidate division Zixibacteria bacterium]